MNSVTSNSGSRSLVTSEVDALFEVLSDGRRRRILAYLVENDIADYDELIDSIVGRKEETADEDERDRIVADLHHRQLPKLADADLVEYDERSETVRYRGGDVVPELLELASTHEREVLEA